MIEGETKKVNSLYGAGVNSVDKSGLAGAGVSTGVGVGAGVLITGVTSTVGAGTSGLATGAVEVATG